MNEKTPDNNFTQPLLAWFIKHGRKNLPWQQPKSPYRVWISEIMLQQTQVKTAIPYFNRFIARFPDVNELALTLEDEVLALWSGLGYYSRARNLHKTAIIIARDFKGKFPDDLQQLVKLPGIGDSTAAAIASLAFNKPAAILDGNVKRVLCRYFLVDGLSEQRLVKQKLWQLANACMPKERCDEYTQAIMDLGATCCKVKVPKCLLCPLQKTCRAHNENRVIDYPAKKPKKTLPIKQQQFVLLHTPDNLIYLEKNPPVGIWGGLWCMPMVDASECPRAYIHDTYALQADNMREIMSIKHSFSHFHLLIKALSLQTTISGELLAESSGRWFTAAEIANLGIAKPVSVIINYFLKMRV